MIATYEQFVKMCGAKMDSNIKKIFAADVIKYISTKNLSTPADLTEAIKMIAILNSYMGHMSIDVPDALLLSFMGVPNKTKDQIIVDTLIDLCKFGNTERLSANRTLNTLLGQTETINVYIDILAREMDEYLKALTKIKKERNSSEFCDAEEVILPALESAIERCDTTIKLIMEKMNSNDKTIRGTLSLAEYFMVNFKNSLEISAKHFKDAITFAEECVPVEAELAATSQKEEPKKPFLQRIFGALLRL